MEEKNEHNLPEKVNKIDRRIDWIGNHQLIEAAFDELIVH